MRIKPGFALLLLVAGSVFAQPVASRIAVGSPDANYRTAVTGAAGAVEPNADIILLTLDSGHYATTRAAADGSFTATLFAPRGTSILVKSDPEHAHVPRIADSPQGLLQGFLSEMLSLHGTIVRAEVPASPTGLPYAVGGGDPDLNFAWAAEGTLSKQQFAPGETIEARGTFTIVTSSISAATSPRLTACLQLELLSDAGGTPSTAWSVFDSAVMTPTGLPIERYPHTAGPCSSGSAMTIAGNKASAEFTVSFTIPADYRAGYYLPFLFFGTSGIPAAPADLSEKRVTFVSKPRHFGGASGRPPVIRLGAPAPPRIPALLLMNDLIEGHRGVVAVADRGRYAPANHIAIASEVAVVPRLDPRTGVPRRYRLEPFVMSMGVADRGGPPNPPFVSLKFPSGSLTVTVQAPSGAARTLGPAPFRQWHLVGVGNRNGQTMEGGPHITDPFELRTLDPAFDVAFSEEGLHMITVNGSIDDLSGTTWRLGGTYEVNVARSLIIDAAVLPMTPFEVSDSVAADVQLVPPVPADVEVRIRHAAQSKLPAIDRRIAGKANRFGRFAPGNWFSFSEPGEYRLDVVARYRAPDGSFWVGSRTWGGVVGPRSPSLIAHGRRGIDAQPGEKQQWYFRSQTGDPLPSTDHVQFAFHSGDVMWLQESDSSIPFLSFQDPAGVTTATLLKIRNATSLPIQGHLETRITAGEIPLFSGSTNGRDPHLAPDRVEAWGYSYLAVERPLVRVREFIAEDSVAGYWRFSDRYGLQSGNGANGDLPNDFKFQFGGVVLRGPLFDPPRYAIYGSLFVLVPDNDSAGGTRVFPPFQGNGGGPSGGPLFKLKGKDIELFFHPTAVRPGTVLVQGDTASFAGYSAPTLPSKIAIDVTAPSGRVRTIKGQASRIGWFYDSGSDFIADEPGVWKAKVRITFDGVLPSTSGQVTAPFPTGGVLGSRDGEFYFYVVRGDAASVAVAASAAGQPGAAAPTQFLRPADGPITFTVTPPPGLSDITMSYTTTMPGFILEEGTTSALTYAYDAQRLAKDFPNLDLTDHDNAGGADVITISLLVSGTDAAGKRQHAARTIVIAGEEMLMPEQPPVASPGRRRAAR